MKGAKQSNRQSILVFLSLLFSILFISYSQAGVLGPGWFMGEADPVSSGEARAYYNSKQLQLDVQELEGTAAVGTSAMAALFATELTSEIKELARALQYDPKLIFDYVHNHIDYVPYFGSLKGATLTYLDGSGNDFDQASLFIALLNESKTYNASIGLVQYVYGTMNIPNYYATGDYDLQHWLSISANSSVISKALSGGGIPATVYYWDTDMDRVWVKATINGTDYLFDPAFKKYDETAGINLKSAMGYDRAAFLTVVGGEVGTEYIRNLNDNGLRSKLVDYSNSMVSFLRSNYPNAEMSDIIGSRMIIQETLDEYPTGLRFPYTVTTYWDSIPDSYIHKVHIQHGQIDQIFSIPDIMGKRLAITYNTGSGGAGAMSTTATPYIIGSESSGTQGINPISVQEQFPPVFNEGSTLPISQESFSSPETIPLPYGEIVPLASQDSGLITIQGDNGTVDFGRISGSSYVDWPVSFSNPSGNPTLNVISALFNNSSGAYSIVQNGGSRTVAPGGSITITTRFSASGQSRGTKTAVFNLDRWYSGYSHTFDSWNLTGFVAESPNLSGSYGVSMLTYLNQQLDNTARLKNSGSQTLTITSMSLTGSNPNMFQIISGGGTGNISAGNYRDIVVRYLATSRGTHTANVHVVFTYDGISGYQVDLPLQGQTVYAPDFTGSYGMNFGQRYLNDFAQGTVVLKNSGTLNLTINSITLTGNDSSRFQILSGSGSGTLTPGQVRNIDVKYLANALGTHNAAIHVSYTYDGLSDTVDLTLTGETISAPAAQLWLDDDLIAEETGTISGPETAAMTLTIDHPYAADSGTYGDQTSTYNLKRGSSYVIISDFGSSEAGRLLKKRQRILEDYRNSGLPDSSREVLTETLNVMGQTWMQQTTLSDNLLSQLSNVIQVRHHRFGIMAQEEGYYVDVKTQLGAYISRSNVTSDENACFKAGSFLGSALEHGVLEQLQGVDRPAASTIKLMHLANSQGNKIFLANSANFSSIQTQLTGYSTQDLQDFQNAVNDGFTLILSEDGQLALQQWSGKGYVKFKQDISGKAEMGMIIGGDYSGGYAGLPQTILVDPVYNDFFPELIPDAEYWHPSSKEPVDMVTGAYLFESEDLSLGGAEPLGLHFKRYYNSDNHNNKSAQGYGWTHSYNIYIDIHSDIEAGLARRQPVDAVASLVASVVTLDLMNSSMPTVKEWTTTALVNKWSMDELFENAVSVHLQDKVLTYILLPDGTFSSPPGVTTNLVKQTGLYQLQERFGTRINFNTSDNINSWIDVDENTMTFTYNGDKLSTVRDAVNRTLTFTYTGELLTSVSDSSGRSVSYGYNNDNLTSYVDPEYKNWNYGYEDINNIHLLTRLTNPLVINTALNSYDSLGRVKTQTVPRQNGIPAVYNFYFTGFRNAEEDPDGKKIIYNYDEKGRILTTEDQLGNKIKKEYDGQNHVVKTVDPRENQGWFYYDGNHNLIQSVDAFSLVTDYIYDSQFRLTDTVDPIYHGNHLEYDSEHHPILSKFGVHYDTNLLPTDNGLYQNSSTYYSNGFTQTTTDGRSTITTLTYDSYGNPDTTRVGSHPVIDYAYDPIGRMTGLTDQVNSATMFTYDKRSLLKLRRDPLLKDTTLEYDNAGQLAYQIDRNNQRIDYAYTPTGKVDTITYPDTSTVHFTYNQHDDLTGIQDGIGNTSYVYDEAHRLTSSTFTYTYNPAGFAVSYEYDANSNLKKLTYPGNKTVTYTYDALNRIKTVKNDWLNQTATYYYDYAGRLDYVVNFNGTITDYGYDNANRLTVLANKKSDTSIISSYSFTLDGNGNRTEVEQDEPLTFSPGSDEISYTYNAKKNRLMTAGVFSFGYDDEGQLSTGYSLNYDFDYEHRLATAESAQYYYDGKGNRVQADRGGVTTRYIYDTAGNLLAEADGSNNITKYYIHGSGLLAMVTQENQTYCYHFNSVGSTVAMTDASQVMVNKYSFDPFGKVTNSIEAIQQSFKFVGQHSVMAEPNGLYYMRARYYDPEIGRFISEDPLGFDGGDVNLMVYVTNNPVLFIDPSGLELRIYNRPAEGPIGWLGGNHAFLYSTDEQSSAGMGASSGREGNRNEDISGLSYTVVPNPDSVSEREIMDYMTSTMNTGVWFPVLNDCHTKVDNTLQNFNLQNQGAPGGRVGSIPNSPSSK
jgi:RHS repeat-associated protein